METPDIETELLEFFKALADASRLKIIGLLAQREYSGEELAAFLDIKPSTVTHHLSYLIQAGLVSARAESYYNFYRLESKTLEEKARRLLSRESFQTNVDGVDLDAYDKQVVKNFLTPEGRLKSVPLQRKKLLAILRYIVQSFEVGQRYSEREVNDIIRHFDDDTAGLRRDLVDHHLMTREASVYWRIDRE